jgi:prepilin-type N-terminal cleavage/methylation domain-containing protein
MTRKRQVGFTLLETLVALAILVSVSGIVISGMIQMMNTQGALVNRTELHTSVRSATELLTQEIGQAGKISLPAPPPGTSWVMDTPVIVPPPGDTPVTTTVTFNVINPVTGSTVLFEGEWVTVDTGASRETVQLTCAAGLGACPSTANTWNATFNNSHAAFTPINVQGAFSTGIVPPAAGVMPNPPAGYGGYPNGSTGTVLKLYGDVNGDGTMVYVEYTCDWANGIGNGPVLYRNQMLFDAATKPALNPSLELLTSLDPQGNPNDATGTAVPCFKYQIQTRDGANAVAEDRVFVTDVAITLTVDTKNLDPQTHKLQVETKALLNVSPRNVFDAWEMDSLNYVNRVQPTPSVTKANLLP